MAKTRFETGMENISPDLGKYIVEFACGAVKGENHRSFPAVHPLYRIPQSSECRLCRKKIVLKRFDCKGNLSANSSTVLQAVILSFSA